MRIKTFFHGWEDIGRDYRKALRHFRHVFETCPAFYRKELFSHYFDGITYEEMAALDEKDRQNGRSH